jgi:hypothetical protein
MIREMTRRHTRAWDRRRIVQLLGLMAMVGCVSAPSQSAVSAGAGAGAVPAAQPYTLWTFLGLDPLFAKASIKADHLHAKMAGLHPMFAPRLPLKPLNDPALAQSPNVAVAGAAAVVAKKAEVPQTKAALAAIGDLGCACDPGAMTALLAGLDSCFPEVRLAAAEAVRRSVRLAEDECDPRRCCSPELSDKLFRMGWGCDEEGCFLEHDADVRLAARQAYRACGCQPCSQAVQPIGSQERPHDEVLKSVQAGP